MISAQPPALSELTADRHPSVRLCARWLEPNPALVPPQSGIAALFRDVAAALLMRIPGDDPELSRALGLLVQTKDAAVRASIASAEADAGA